ncbi:MAG: hypothetical protein CMM92_03315 [Rickettsiales bacterium]|nr:hypothetical protein [Rickettsiales bacterium]RPG14550.1 MAG: hypothetical protein CBD55_003300 [Pelagibacteraceae bacterium TMED195]
MNLKFLKNFSFFFSILILVIFTCLFSFTLVVSEKPMKINILDLFDRKSEILKKKDVREIGDIYVSFNKVSKKFEFLIEDILINEFFFPSVTVSLDLSLSRDFLNTSLKLFDGELSFREKKKNSSGLLEEIENFTNNDLVNFFSEIEVVNNRLIFFDKNNIKFEYLVDLIYKSKSLQGIISQYTSADQNLSFIISNDDYFSSSLEANSFNVEFIESLFSEDYVSFNGLKISGNAEIKGDSIEEVNYLDFDLTLNGNIEYLTFSGKKKINFTDNLLIGSFDNNKADISSNFFVRQSSLKVGFKKKPGDFSVFYLGIDKITVSNLLKIWPKNVGKSTYDWMVKNSMGEIENVSIEIESDFKKGKFDIKNLKGNFECKNVEISYMESMPPVKNINGLATIFKDKVVFDIKSGQSNNLNLKSGIVSLYDLNTDFEQADIFLDIISKNTDVVKYLNLTTIEKKNYSKLEKISGEVDLTLNLQFPLLVDLEVEQINYSSNANLLNGFLENLYEDYSIENLDLEIEINRDFVNYSGSGEINNSSLKFQGEQKKVEEKFVDEINGNLLYNGENILEFFPGIIDKISGVLDLDFIINSFDDDYKIEAIGITNNLSIVSNFLGEKSSFSDGKIRLLVNPYDKNYSGFFDLKTNNVDIEINTVFSKSGLLSLKVNEFLTPIQDFKMDLDLEKFIGRISGNKISIPKIDLKDESFFSDLGNLDFNVDIEKIILGKNKFLKPLISFKKENYEFSNLNIELNGEKDYHKVQIFNENQKKKFFLESNYAPRLLNIFDISLNLNKGSLKIEGEKSSNSGDYTGNIAGKDLVFLDTPFFVDFITLFSLKGLAQKLKDGGIIFEDFTSTYEFSNNKLRLVDSLIKGSELGLSFDTVVGFDNDYFLTTGTIIPAYTLNTLITNFPIVGDIITAGSPEDGLLGASFKIEKKEGEFDISYNPISVFVPNLFKNFLAN